MYECKCLTPPNTPYPILRRTNWVITCRSLQLKGGTATYQASSSSSSPPLIFNLLSTQYCFALLHCCIIFNPLDLSFSDLVNTQSPSPTVVIMSDVLLKPEKDFSKDADKLIPEAEALAKVRLKNILT